MAPAAAAAPVCTGWTSESSPPATIRVYRTGGAAVGTVQVIPFRQYVGTVIASEWGASNPTEGLKVGAIAVKQYAWYRAMIWRGKTAPDGSCYDVVDSTIDQLYNPDAHPMPSQLAAIESTWTVSLRKAGHLFPTHYQNGSAVACGADADGQILYEQSINRCARDGMLLDAILHRYLDPGLEIVGLAPARVRATGDVTGDGVGDLMVVSPGADPATTTVRIYASGKAAPPPTAVTTAIGIAPSSVAIPPAETVFRQFVDLTGDRLDDMVVLQRAGAGYQLWLAPATGAGFGAPVLVWSSEGSGIPLAPTTLVRLVAGDFDGDGLPDLGLLVGEPGPPVADGGPVSPPPTPVPAPTPTPTTEVVVIGATPSVAPSPSAVPTPTATVSPTSAPPPAPPPTATFWLLRGTGGGGLAPAVPWWSGPLNLQGTAAFGGDVDGDGRADLIVQMDMTKQVVGGTGLREVVVRAGAPAGSPPEVWGDLPDSPVAAARTAIADVNGDGRSDVLIDRLAGTVGSQILGLLSSGAGFVPRSLWANARSFRWSASRIAAVDVNADGRDDVVVLYNAGAGGSRIYQFLSSGTSLKAAGATTDPALPWAGAAPY